MVKNDPLSPRQPARRSPGRLWATAQFAGWALLASIVALPAASAQQFAIDAASVAPAQISDGQRKAVLRLTVANPAAGGVPVVRWESVGLRFEAAPGSPLSIGSASTLIATLELCRDGNASGTFEPAADPVVASSFFLPLATDGALNFLFENSDPALLEIPAGGAATYFLVLHLANAASAVSPATLRVSHLANGAYASTARRVDTGILLGIMPAPDVSSATMTIVAAQAPTTTGIVPIVTQVPANPTVIPLTGAFQDVEDAPAQLSYSVTANSNAALFTFDGIDPSTGVLTFEQLANANGQSQVTVQATDTSGRSVATTFRVHVGPLPNYAAFAGAYFGAGGAGVSGVTDDPAGSGVTNLLKYAFFLHPLKNGDRAGLPTLRRAGQARVFSHLRPKFATDLTYTYEKSADLVTWVPAVSGVDYFAETLEVGDGSQRVECLLLGTAARTFLRTKVLLTSNPPPAFGSGNVGDGSGTETAGSAAGASGGNPPPPPNPPLPIHSSVVFPGETQALTGSGLVYPQMIVAADLNNDSWIDLVCISDGDDKVAWYPNNNGVFGARQVLTGNTRAGSGIAVGDVTGDGHRDIAATGFFSTQHAVPDVGWFRAMGAGALSSMQGITTNAGYALAASMADMDNDGLIDIVSASGFQANSKLAWYKNRGTPFFFSGAQQNIILGSAGTSLSASGDSPYSVAAENIDQDPNGWADIAVVSFSDSSVSFLRGNGGGSFTRQILSNSQLGAIEVALGDMDGDGLKDIVSIATQGGGQVTWFKNNGAAPFGPANTIATGGGLNGLHVADLDKDGRMDVIVSAVPSQEPPYLPSRHVWFRNLGGGAFGDPAANAQFISASGNDGVSVTSGDFDKNGLLDTAVAWKISSKVSVYLNRGGQYGLATASTAPGVIHEAGRDDVLRISLTNNGSPGEDFAQLATVSLLFEKSAGVPMTTVEVNQLIENLHVYVDGNASGAFEPGVDALVATAYHLSLTAGKASVSLRYSVPAAVQVAPGATRHFFIVPQIAATGAAQTPNTFRITHLVEGLGSTTARESYSGNTLALESGPLNVASGFVTAQPNAAPTTIGLPNVTVFDPATTTWMQLTNYFADAEDGPAGLQYAVVANTNPALFSFVGLEPATRRLALHYRPGVSGAATLTVRATDTLGKSVASTFQVTRGFTFGDWSALYPGAGGGALTPLAQYAFGLNPLTPGSLAGAPQMWRDGSVKGLRHLRQRWSSDLLYSYQISPDLVNWSSAVPGVHFHEFRDRLSGGLDQSDLVLIVDWPRAFLRPQAQIP